MLVQCYVADADPFSRQLLCDTIARDSLARIVGATSDERHVLRDVRHLRPHAIFVDTWMSRSILQARRASRTALPYCLVLVSALPSDAASALTYDATDFVLKPCSRARVADALERVRRHVAAAHGNLVK